MQSKLSMFLNDIFKYLVFFCLYFLWFSYYLQGIVVIICVSVIFSAITCFFLSKIFYKKHNRKKLTQQEQKDVLNISRQLLFFSQAEVQDYFFNVLNSKDFEVTKTELGLQINHNNNQYLFLPTYHKINVNEDLIVNLIKMQEIKIYKKIIISAISFSDEAKNIVTILKDCNIVLLNEKDTFYKIIQLNKIMPKEKMEFKSEKKLKWKEILNVALSREKSKGYFFSGLILLFASYFVRFGLYYIISSSVLFILSLFSFYNHKYNSPKINIFE